MNPVRQSLFDGVTNFGALQRPSPSRCRTLVRNAINSSWHAYRRFAWGHDEIRPLSRSGRDWYGGGRDAVCSSFAFTIVDSLDTLWLAGLMDEFNFAVSWLEQNYERHCLANLRSNGLLDERVSFFEASIRVVGGLISAFELSRRRSLLDLAVSVADDLLSAAMASGNALPHPYVALNPSFLERLARRVIWWGEVSLAVGGSTHIEYRALSRLTGDPKYGQFADAMEGAFRSACPSAPCPLHWYTSDAQPVGARGANLGSGGDSYYEYVLKSCLQRRTHGSGKEFNPPLLLRDCEHWEAVSAAIIRGSPVREYEGARARLPGHAWGGDWFEELSCFTAGLFALSHLMFPASYESAGHLQFGADVALTCVRVATELYPLPPERVRIRGRLSPEDDAGLAGNWAYHLRPEGFESLYYLWRATGNQEWRDMAWIQFASIYQHLYDPSTGAFTAAWDVRAPLDNAVDMTVELHDRMESFWIAETLKYLWLTFAEPADDIAFDTYIFTTEAHLVRRG